jgi:hypothetical protein
VNREVGRHTGGAPRVPFALLLAALIVGGLVLLLVLNTASAANEVTRHDFAARDASIAAQVQELRNEVAASSAPGNLARAAAELGMVPAGNPAFLVVGAHGSVQVMGSAAPVSGIALVQQPRPRHKHTDAAAKTSADKSTAAKSTAAKSTAAKSTQSTTAHAKSTPQPTPTLTLPGGNR